MPIKLKDGFQGSRMIDLPAAVIRDLEAGEYTSLLHATDIGHFPKAKYHYRHRPSGAEQYILIYCTDGYGWINYAGKKHTISPGTFFIIPAGAPHTYGADEDDPWSIYWVHFKGKLAGHFAEGCNCVCGINVTEDSRITSRLNLFEELYRSIESGYGREQLNYTSAVLNSFLGSFKYIEAFRHTGTHDADGRDTIDRCRHYIMENIERRITLNDICSYLGFSSSYCTSLFNRYTGMSPGQYILNLRIQKAVHLMEVTDLKINQICHKVGIDDPYYFSRIFSKTMGISPKAYRHGGGE